jgi:hypothetical protein
VVVHEPGALKLDDLERCQASAIAVCLADAAVGPRLQTWIPPPWLLPHQRPAAQRIVGTLPIYGGALLADAVGLGKTYVSLAVASRYERVVAVVPAALLEQWRRTAERLGLQVDVVSHEGLSRGRNLPTADLVIVDEAHRFRNRGARRYDRLARGLATAHVLLVTATPVVNRGADLAAILRLFLPDHGLAAVGVRSLEQTIASRDYVKLAEGAAVLTVARTTRSLPSADQRLPRPVDLDLGSPPPLAAPELLPLLERIDRLRFAGFSGPGSAPLLRGHLLHRLASSVEALRLTLRRHLAYADRALTAARSGIRLSRVTSRQLFGAGDDLQLELPHLAPAPIERDLEAALMAERAHLLGLLRLLPQRGHRNPKAQRLARVLDSRGRPRVIVFTAAMSTATDLASRWGWRRTAVVGAGRARIATGPISVDDALDRFAPDARRARHPPTVGDVTTLIATDLVSEGLDLQDAAVVVHYDLPWTPVRLAQRVGRVARLGSAHRNAHVLWFRPPVPLEQRLRMERRIAMKAVTQMEMLVPETSRVGTARKLNTQLELREHLSLLCAEQAHPDHSGRSRSDHAARIAVVCGPPMLAAAVRWTWNDHSVPQLVVLAGQPPQVVHHVRQIYMIIKHLFSSPASHRAAPTMLMRTLWHSCRDRLAAWEHGPMDSATRRLRRRVLARGLAASREHDLRLLTPLDDVLDRLGVGQPVGMERELERILDDGSSPVALAAWCSRCRPRAGPADVQFDGILVGDGTSESAANAFENLGGSRHSIH